MPDDPLRAVLDPACTFAEIAAALEQAGWRRCDTGLARPPLKPGEPELARWQRGEDALTYSFNPAVSLRILGGTGRLPPLPTLDEAAIGALLGDRDPRRALCGALAAAELGLAGLAPAVRALARHPDPAVARLARGASQRLAAAGATSDTPALAAFDTADAVSRRQVLRWLVADRPGAAEPVLARALASGDAELAASAVIFAARLGLTALRGQVAAASLEAPGLDRMGRQFLEALRRAALATLAGERPGAGEDMRTRLWRALLGLDRREDWLAMTVASLTEPLPDLPPPEAPPGLWTREDGAVLEPPGVAFRPVAAVAHWLGHDEADGFANRVRRWTPPDAYWIAAAPLSRRQLDLQGSDETVALVTTGEAEAALASLGVASGQALRLPSPDEWEAGLRGPDGRRFPWGFLPRPSSAFAAHSPWGVRPGPRGVGEWTSGRDGEGAVLCGADPRGQPALRLAAPCDARHALRPVLVPHRHDW